MPNSSDLEWRPVVGFEGIYEVSDHGDVKRILKAQGTAGGLLKQSTHPVGYKMVALSKDNIRTTAGVHRLVAAAFIGPRPDGMEVCYNNQVHGDNRAVNLRYDTHKANCAERVPGVIVNRRTICRNGLHEFTPENTSYTSKGFRQCIACRKAKDARRAKGVDYSKACRNGHERDKYPLYVSPSGHKECAECRRIASAKSAAKKKARKLQQRNIENG